MYLYNLRNDSAIQKKTPPRRKCIRYVGHNKENSPVTYDNQHYTGGPKSHSKFENVDDKTELCRYAKRWVIWIYSKVAGLP